MLLGCLTVLILLSGISLYHLFLNQQNNMVNITKNNNVDLQQISFDSGIDLKDLYSEYAILVDLESNTILASHNENKKIYPASLTKIMTAIVAIENISDMDHVITLPKDSFYKLYEENASMAGFLPGEQARLKDLLYGILLSSGAECCMAFAYYIAGSEKEFVALMNQKAKELNMEDTHFCNVTGLHNDNHYSTVEDMSKLLRYALKNSYFKDAFTSSRYAILPSLQHPDGFTLYHTMFEYIDSKKGNIIGGKTGYTKEAGLCLASLADIHNKEYILVTAHANGDHQSEPFHILDAIEVYKQME